MIGERKFKTVTPGREYLLSDGTPLKFLARDEQGRMVGITSEELIQVLIHRLSYQRESFNSREASLAITALEEAEEKLWRWDVNRALKKREQPQTA